MSYTWVYNDVMKKNREIFPPQFQPALPNAGRGISDLTGKVEIEREGSTPGGDPSETLPIESALLSLCHELAGMLIRALQGPESPAMARKMVSQQLGEKLEVDRFQADCIVALSIELIRVKCAGHYRRNSPEMRSLIAGALGQNSAEGLN